MRATFLALATLALAQRRPSNNYPGSEECSSVLSAAAPSLTAIPEPDTFISNMAYGYHYNRFTNSADPCAPPEVTGVSAEPFSEWVASYTEWREGMVPEYKRVWEACSRDPQIFQVVPAGPEHCSSLAAEITGQSGGDGGDDGDDDDEDSGSGSGGGGDGDADEESGDDDDESSALKGTGGIVAAAALAGVVMAGMLY